MSLAGKMGRAVVMMAAAAPAYAQAPESRVIGTKIAVGDFQRSADFYGQLGMVVGRKPNAIEWELKSPGDQAGAVIYIVRNPSRQARIPAGGGFVMISVPSVRAAAAKLKAAGYSNIGEPRSNPRYSLLIVRDPDANQVELISSGEQ